MISCHESGKTSTWVISYLRFVFKDIYSDNQFWYHLQFHIKDSQSNRTVEFTSSYDFFHNLSQKFWKTKEGRPPSPDGDVSIDVSPAISHVHSDFFDYCSEVLIQPIEGLVCSKNFKGVIESQNWVRNHRLPFHFHDRVILTIRLANLELYSSLSFVQYKSIMFPLIKRTGSIFENFWILRIW